HDRVEPDVLQEHDVAGELLAQRLVLHRRAAVLDDDRAAVELADVGQRLHQDLHVVQARMVRGPDLAVGRQREIAHGGHQVVYSELIDTYSWVRSEKKTSVSAPSPGSPISYCTSR